MKAHSVKESKHHKFTIKYKGTITITNSNHEFSIRENFRKSQKSTSLSNLLINSEVEVELPTTDFKKEEEEFDLTDNEGNIVFAGSIKYCT